ncbi:MAG: NAD-dependent epimerase/dehydratase family protein [Patescibacteria group bacterium]
MKVLVTGGAGFVGSHLVEALVERGYDVSVIDSLRHGGKKENVHPDAQLFVADITNHTAIKKILKNVRPKAILHLASQINVRHSIDNPQYDQLVNTQATINLIETAKNLGLKTFVYASTGGVMYGDDAPRPTTEEHPAVPTIPYCISKLSAENYLRFFSEKNDIRFVALRPSNIYGPRQNPHGEAGVIAIFLEKMIHGINPIIYGDGEQTRDFVYVDDVVRAFILALEKRRVSGVYHISCECEISVNQIFHALNSHFENIFEKKHIPAPWKEQHGSCLSYQKIKNEIGWEPKVALEEGISRIIEDYKKTLAPVKKTPALRRMRHAFTSFL